MEYLIIGAGGTGGCLAAYLAQAGKHVHVIARGGHLDAIRRNGIVLETGHGTFAVPVSASTAEDYRGRPDVIFLCVKDYGVDALLPFLTQLCDERTILIPLLNIYGTGGRLQQLLPRPLVTDGCIYIAGEIKAPGTLLMRGDIFRVVFGVRREEEMRPALYEVERDLCDAGIAGQLSSHIPTDAMVKFSFVSPMAACGLLHDALAGQMQQPGPVRADFTALVEELAAVADAMGLRLPTDLTARNLQILDGLAPGASTSLKRDVDADRPSELDGLIFQVVRLGRQHGVPTPRYLAAAQAFGFQEEA